MKRLVAAAIILVFTVSVCICAHIRVDRACAQTLKDVEDYYNENITDAELEHLWEEHKEKMSVFVNHGFLDKISIYIGQLTVYSKEYNSTEFDVIYKNIQTVLSLIKEEQKFALHSFY